MKNGVGAFLHGRCMSDAHMYRPNIFARVGEKKRPNTVVDVLSVMENQADVKVRRADDSGERERD